MANWWRNRRGDTLVEVVLAIAILASVLATAYHMSTVAFQLGVESRERTQAINLVQQQAEALRWYADSQMAAGTPLLSSSLGGCTAGCYMTPVTASGTTVVGGPPTTCGAIIPTCKLGFKTVTPAIALDPNASPPFSKRYPEVNELVTVTWVDAATGLTDTSSLNLRLADTTAFHPLDCSVAGSTPGCSVNTSPAVGSGGAAGPTGGGGGGPLTMIIAATSADVTGSYCDAKNPATLNITVTVSGASSGDLILLSIVPLPKVANGTGTAIFNVSTFPFARALPTLITATDTTNSSHTPAGQSISCAP